MQETSTPAAIELDDTDTIPGLLFQRARRTPRANVFARRNAFGSGWENVSANEFASDIIDVSRGLIGLGLEVGDRICIMGGTSYEWTLIDYAAQSAGLVVVPIYETDASAQVEWILTDTKARLVITDTPTQARLVQDTNVRLDLPVFSLADGSLDVIRSHGFNVTKAQVMDRLRQVNVNSLASIIYTSGTTGKPKGVELTQGNFVFMALTIGETYPELIEHKTSRILLFLPLAHVFGRFASYTVLCGRGILANIPNTHTLLDDLQSFKPTTLIVVPRVLEKVYTAASAKAGRGLKHQIFTWATKTAITSSTASMDSALGKRQLFKLRTARRLVLDRIRTLIGGQVEYIISGGAPLGPRLGHFYRGMGITILEGWGLTETTGPATGNNPLRLRIPSVGVPIAGMSVRVNDTGEIEVKGPIVARGYHNNPQATAQSFKDGWFSTGDLGSIDEDGFVFITGRRKELIITASGKNVAPSQLEDAFRGHPLVSNVIVIGDQRPFISALVTIDREMLPLWLANHKLPAMDVASAARHPVVQEHLQKAADRASESVSRAESIRKVKVLLNDFTVDNGLLTASLKVRRPEVLKRYAKEIEELYKK